MRIDSLHEQTSVYKYGASHNAPHYTAKLHQICKLSFSSVLKHFLFQNPGSMANKQIDLNVEAENVDLTLCLGNRSSSESSKKRKAQPEEVGNTSTRQTLEDKIAVLEHRLQEVERSVNQRAYDLAVRMDQNFLQSNQSLHEQISRNSARLNDIHTILHSIIMSFRPTITSEHRPASTSKPGASSSGSKKPPRP